MKFRCRFVDKPLHQQLLKLAIPKMPMKKNISNRSNQWSQCEPAVLPLLRECDRLQRRDPRHQLGEVLRNEQLLQMKLGRRFLNPMLASRRLSMKTKRANLTDKDLGFGRVTGNDLLRSVAMVPPSVRPVEFQQLIASQTPDLSQVWGLSFFDAASQIEVLTNSWGGNHDASVLPEQIVCCSAQRRRLASACHVTWPTSQFCQRRQARVTE